MPGRTATRPPLYLAAVDGYFELIRTLLRHNADVNAQTPDGDTPLHRTSKSGHIDMYVYSWITAPIPRHVVGTRKQHCISHHSTGNWRWHTCYSNVGGRRR